LSRAAPASACCALALVGMSADAAAAGRQSALNPAGPVATEAAHTAWLLIVGAALVFVLVMAVLALALWRRGRTSGSNPGTVAWLLGAGVGFPTMVLAALLAYTTLRSERLGVAPAADELLISVTARMWWWEVRYTDPRGGLQVVSANEIRLPAGKPVVLGLNSADVIHSFWVPALAGKVDMVPGRVHQLRVQAEAPGVWRGQCAEFCGEQHARMALQVVVMAPAAFDAWRAAQARPAQVPADGEAARGRAVFVAQRCVACHRVRGAAEGGTLGPDLTHLASRSHLGAGTLANHRANLAEWVGNVQGVKSGARMPSYDRLDADTMAALTAFLASLD
jgi:cytochrome c oxidase subunit 2